MAILSLSTRYNNVSESFMIFILVLSCIWFVRYLYSQRKFYKLSWQLDGPIAWPIIGNALWFYGSTEDIFRALMTIASSYRSPSRVWLGNRLYICIIKPKDLETILNSYKAIEKDYLYSFLEPVIGKGLFTASVARWKRHRKIIMPTFNQKILNMFMDVFVEQSEVLVENLKNHIDKGYFDIFEPVSQSMLVTVCETTMGIKVNAENEDCRYMNLVHTIMDITWNRAIKIWYNLDFIFNLLPVSKIYYEAIKEVHNFTNSVIVNKRKEVREKLRIIKSKCEVDDGTQIKISKRKAFLELLIELCEEGTKFTDDELREEVDTFMAAGSDTSAGVISFVCMMLGAHPDVQEKAYEEIVDVVGEYNWTVTTECLPKFQYLERVIKETMRLFPVGTLLIRTFTDDVKIESCTIPRGTSAVLGIAQTHRDPDIWSDPLKFDPDRFLPEEVAKRHPYSYLPFSGGYRNCIGARYAMMVMKTQIAIMLLKYKFRANNKPKDIRLKAELLLLPVDGYQVEIELRN